MDYIEKMKKVGTCFLTGITILSGLNLTAFAEEKVLTDHNTYYIGTTEYNMDGTLVDKTTDPCYQEIVVPDTDTDTTDPDKDNTDGEEKEDTSTEEKEDDSSKQDTNTDANTEHKENTSQNASNDTSYESDTWYHPSDTSDSGYIGEVKNAIKLDSFVTDNWSKFTVAGNPFSIPQCTYFAWSRFYQIYGYDSGARGNGKTNAKEIVNAHSDKFKLSSTPAGGAVFSYEKNALYPEYGHVGFVEAYDGTYIWISEGNYCGGKIHFQKIAWATFKAMYPDVVFAVPNEGYVEELNSENVEITKKDEVKVEHTKQYTMNYLATGSRKHTMVDKDGKEIKQLLFSESQKIN